MALLAAGPLLLASGCGSSSHDNEARKTACAKVTTSLQQFERATAGLAGALEKPAADKAVIAGAHRLSLDVQELARSSSGSEKSMFNRLVAALSQDETVIRALEAHDRSRASKESAGLSEGLGLVSQLKTSCAQVEKS